MDLEPVYSNVKSFYGKARVLKENGVIKLLSYDTVIAEIKDNKVHINGFYSQTSTRHLKEFLKQYGFKTGTRQQLEKMYC